MPVPTLSLTRLAGVLYTIIIVAGIGSEGLLRGHIPVPGDAAATAANLLANEAALRGSILADVAMALADVGLGAALLVLLWRVGPTLAIGATVFRLAQAAVLGMNLVLLVAALNLAPTEQALSALALDLHGVGYDVGLFFFAVNCVLTAVLICRAGAPQWLALGLLLSGVVYGLGSVVAVAAPGWSGVVEPAYLVSLVSEVALAVWLLGGNLVEGRERTMAPAR